MAMSKKHYKAIADVLRWREGDAPHDRQIILEAARGLATVFAEDNPRFDRERFIEAVTNG